MPGGRIVTVGGGLIGMEMAEALTVRRVKAAAVEMLDRMLAPFLDLETAALAHAHLREHEGSPVTWGRDGVGADRVLTVLALWSSIITGPLETCRLGQMVSRDKEVAATAMAEDKETEAVPPEEAPEGKPIPRRGRRGEVRVFGNWCKGCGLCVAFCPRDVFATGTDGHPLAVYPERCTACMWCVEHCPDFAIVVRPVEAKGEERRDAA